MNGPVSELIFYTNPRSRGQIARWMLEEVGQPYEEVILEYGTTMKAPEYLAINPMGKVPAIRHGGHVVTEAAAICAYLGTTFTEAQLAPTDDERADFFRWLFFAAGPVEAVISNRMLGFEVPSDKEGTIGYGTYDRVIDTLSGVLEDRKFICGDRFTAADVYVGAQVDWGLMFKTIPARPAFSAYAERLRARPAYLKAKSMDAALIAASKG